MHFRKRKGSGRSKYVKVPIKTKLRFLRKVVLEGLSIKDSATIFDINYSTAKTLIGQYKTQSFPWSLSSFTDETELEVEGWRMKRCGYRELIGVQQAGEHSRSSPFQLLGSSGNGREGEEGLKVVSSLHQQVCIVSSTNHL